MRHRRRPGTVDGRHPDGASRASHGSTGAETPLGLVESAAAHASLAAGLGEVAKLLGQCQDWQPRTGKLLFGLYGDASMAGVTKISVQ